MLDISRLFEETAYIAQNPDVKEAITTGVVESGFEHFITFGQLEGRNPSIWFDTDYYLEENPDVAEAVAVGTLSAIEHFVNFGQSEGRDPIAEFFTDFYLEAYPDVAATVAAGVMTPYQHFREFGLSEGREPGFGFDRPFYLANNADVAAAVNAGQISAIEHYLRFGKAEGRPGTPTLDLDSASDLGLLGVAEINGIVSDRNPQQFYRFSLEMPSDFNLDLGGLSNDADVVLFQDLNENGELDFEEILDLSANEGTTPEAITRGLPAGTYFIGIERFEGNTNYTLLLSAAPRLDVPPDNIGNTLSEAFNLTPDFTRAPLNGQGRISINAILEQQEFPVPEQVGDFDPSDIYSFVILAPSRFQLQMDGLSGDADVAIAIDRDEDQRISLDEIIASSEKEGTQAEEILIPNLFPGGYYIMVEQFEGDTPYNLTVEASPLAFPLSEAVALGALNPNPQTVTGFLSNLEPANTYNFSLDSPSDIQINLDGLTASAELYLIQDINGNGVVDQGEILTSSPGGETLVGAIKELGEYNSDSEAIAFRGLAAGNYFIGVNQSQEETNYTLSFAATPATSKFNSLFG